MRFVREADGKLAEYIVIAVSFEGDPMQPAAVVILLKPVREALAFQLDMRSGTLRLVAKEPVEKPSPLLPSPSQAKEVLQNSLTLSSSRLISSQCQLPTCGTCQAPDCQCTS